jgi:hypothetical protein
LGIKLIPGGDQPGYGPTLGIYGLRNVTQKFISGNTNLSAIGTSIKNPNLKNKKDIILTLSDENMRLIRTTIISGQNVQDGDFIKFVFDPIPDSKNKTYFFNLNSPTAGPEDLIEVFLSQNPPNWIEQYSYDKNVYPGGVPIVLYYKPVSKIEVVKEIYFNLFSRLLPQSFRKS